MKALLLLGLLAASVNIAAGQDLLAAAKDLYASAAYEEALSALSRLAEGSLGAAAVREADEYRAFCLFALGRTSEAEAVADSIVRRDPLADLSAADRSPRLEAMFAGVRKRVLPAMVRDRYRTVRRLIDDKQYAAAEPQLVEIHALLQAADQLGALDEGLSDLDVLVDGFLALARAQAERAAPSAVPAASSAGAPTGGGAPPPPPSAPPGPRIYGIEDADVTPPLVIDQRVPTVPPQLLTILRAQRRPALLTVVIDDSGNVQKAAIRGSVNAAYDDLLLRAANAWKYKPATRAGVPVWYERTVAVDVK